jgi:hypothetical protein
MLATFFHIKPVAEFIDPWLGDKVRSGIGFVVPARQPCSLAGADFIPQSGIYEFGFWIALAKLVLHYIIMEKSAQPGEGRGVHGQPFHYIYHHVQNCSVRSSWEGRYIPPISTLPLYKCICTRWYVSFFLNRLLLFSPIPISCFLLSY